ncbi:MAG TPA: thioesterase domain-containing protein [Actinocrinis sp.]|nr:thioesterase domain-containing protein [Actinocrinis sp.]
MSAGTGPGGAAARWIHRLSPPRDDGAVRLICFPHAGGSANAFRAWVPLVSAEVELYAVQLPGRAERFGESPIDRMGPLLDHLLDHVAPLLDRPFAMFGYSMGARVALALAQTMRAAGLDEPALLAVGASPGPCLRTAVPGWDRSEEELVAGLVAAGGMPAEVLADAELLELLLPTIRADLTVVATWPYQENRKIGCPIAAFAGSADPYASPVRMAAWAAETTSRFTLTEVDGDHFFISRALPRVVADLDGLLRRADAGQAALGQASQRS